MKLDALYFDGRVSRPQAVQLQLDGDVLLVSGEALQLRLPLGDVKVPARIGNTRRRLGLPEHACIEVADNDALDAMLGSTSRLHGWESRRRLIVASLAGMVLCGWLLLQFGIPWLAGFAAEHMPSQVEVVIGQQALEALDESEVFTPSGLVPEDQQYLRGRFAQLVAGLPGGFRYRLHFRSSEMLGANAIALPGGNVVVTDDLIALAENDEEILAVLAHEAGHVELRHGMRQLLQHSGIGVLVSTVLGDAASAGSIAIAAPLMLAEARYSREFETQADRFAARLMRRRGIALHRFGDLLARLDRQGQTSPGLQRYFASHPDSRQRIRDFGKH